MVANTEEYNLPDLTITNSWTLNTNDLTFGVHVVNITGTVISTKVGPIGAKPPTKVVALCAISTNLDS